MTDSAVFHDSTTDVFRDANGVLLLGNLAYGELKANVPVPVVAAAQAVTVITTGAVTFDGVAPVLIEFDAPYLSIGNTTASEMRVTLWDGTTDLGILGQWKNVGNQVMITSPRCGRRLTPSAGPHTFAIKAYAVGNAGAIQGGNGGAGALVPAYIRVLRA